MLGTMPAEVVRKAALPLARVPDDYDPLLELIGEARLPDQFDALIHLDETRALEPLERTAPWEAGEALETFPSAL